MASHFTEIHLPLNRSLHSLGKAYLPCGSSKAFPSRRSLRFRGRWQPEGLTEEVVPLNNVPLRFPLPGQLGNGVYNMEKLDSKRAIAPAPCDHAAAGDLLRVICVGMIAWYHIWQQSWLSPQLRLGGLFVNLLPPVRAGYMFVDLMLMLSGFLLYLPWANGAERPAREFYTRRALRILPSYWVCLLVMLGFTLADPGFTEFGRLAKDMLAHLTFTHNLFYFSYTATPLNVVLWTLAVEVQFYLLLPALAPAFRKQPLASYLAMVGAALCFQRLWTARMEDTTLFVNRLPNMLDVYANGMLAAHIYAKLAQKKERRTLIAANAYGMRFVSIRE